MATDKTRQTIRCICGGSFYAGDVCHKCSGDGLPPARTQKPEEPPTAYQKETRALIHRATLCATMGEWPAVASVCRELEALLPGMGWAGAAADFEGRLAKKLGPMAPELREAVEEIPF